MRPTATVLVSAAQGYFAESRSLVHNLREISSLSLTLPWHPLVFTRDHDWWPDGCVDFCFRVSFRLVDTSRLTQSEILSLAPSRGPCSASFPTTGVGLHAPAPAASRPPRCSSNTPGMLWPQALCTCRLLSLESFPAHRLAGPTPCLPFSWSLLTHPRLC